MRTNLYLVTVKHGNGSTELLHIQAQYILSAIQDAYDYLDNEKVPGTSYEILEVKYVGEIFISKRDL